MVETASYAIEVSTELGSSYLYVKPPLPEELYSKLYSYLFKKEPDADGYRWSQHLDGTEFVFVGIVPDEQLSYIAEFTGKLLEVSGNVVEIDAVVHHD